MGAIGGTQINVNDIVEHDACGLGAIARVDGRASREIVEQGLVILANLNHRGTVNADGETGDGAGILIQIPDAFFRRQKLGFELPPPHNYAVGTCFFWGSDKSIASHRKSLEDATHEEGQRFLGWREVPTNPGGAGSLARSIAPRIEQFFIERKTPDLSAFERKLYVIRRRVHREIERFHGPGRFYVVSLSPHTIVYKGLLQGIHVSDYFIDLQDPSFTSALALVHSRFSTNTLGNWSLAHPYRYIAHNGEINTLRGNLNWMRAREAQFQSDLFGDDMAKLHPIIEPRVSDSAAFDNALEFLYLGGRSLPQAVMTMVPEAWENNHILSADRRAFYHYSTALMQAWDGPAAIAFTNGRQLGAVLDRNGLRPARYAVTKDGLMVLASEDGVLPLDASDIAERCALGPGRMVLLDLDRGVVMDNDEAKAHVVSVHPYRQWVFDNAVGINDLQSPPTSTHTDHLDLTLRQRIFGYTFEEVRLLLTPMAKTGKEADGSMGTDTPLAVLSDRPKLLFDYFHQLFAQVTNPPIDPLRERGVMSLRVSLGKEHNLLDDGPHHARRIVLPHPILQASEIAKLQANTDDDFKAATISLLWQPSKGRTQLRDALDDVCKQAIEAVQDGATILILSDRGASEERTAIPSLLATGAVYQHLIRSGLGGSAALLVETGEARETHHIAALLAFGARAISPYLAIETVASLATSGKLDDINPHDATRHYIDALNKGVLKIISKMGISTVHSYTGSQLFEIVGLGDDIVKQCFPGAVSRIGGMTLEDIGRECILRFEQAWNLDPLGVITLDPGGEYQYRDGNTKHEWNDETVPTLQRAVRTNNYETWEQFSRACDDALRSHSTLRSLLEIKSSANPIPIDQVEPASEIVKRFNTGAMSLGSLSSESHEALAIAMNHIGGRSNSGEGGEDSARFEPEPDGTWRRSAIKQIASGRFGVTANYLVNADMLQIKVAQGAKPGEGGQLPGHKVSADIARLRHSTPGVGLISPPPHHDIYSIEDLSQLIFDLHMVNPDALVSVKLVAEAGVGTIAAGVAKAKADHVTISGHDGGTGAAALTSIKHAGLPWELGLAEAHQVLVANDLRARVRLQVDGMLRTGRDVVIGALLGADEFGFSTAPLIAMGCVMMRVCHLNTCPVGIATQDPVLRERFRGTPEHVINYFFFVAEEVRRWLAQLGIRNVDELVGRSDLLTRNPNTGNWKTRKLNINRILIPTDGAEWRERVPQQDGTDESFDQSLLPEIERALDADNEIHIKRHIQNTDRSVGARISGLIAKKKGERGARPNSIRLDLNGVAGQSFGAWGQRGLYLNLEGATNDYAGKGLSGATLVVRPPKRTGYHPSSSAITGNVALYGATSGEAYFAGTAGERFAVRNSGAIAVVEGVGDHGCEYMTGGTVVILGPTGRNFAAGMSGGFAYVWEPAGDLRARLNHEMVSLQALTLGDIDEVESLLRRHAELTGSERAAETLTHWPDYANDFVKVVPHDYAKAIAASLNTESEQLNG